MLFNGISRPFEAIFELLLLCYFFAWAFSLWYFLRFFQLWWSVSIKANMSGFLCNHQTFLCCFRFEKGNCSIHFIIVAKECVLFFEVKETRPASEHWFQFKESAKFCSLRASCFLKIAWFTSFNSSVLQVQSILYKTYGHFVHEEWV